MASFDGKNMYAEPPTEREKAVEAACDEQRYLELDPEYDLKLERQGTSSKPTLALIELYNKLYKSFMVYFMKRRQIFVLFYEPFQLFSSIDEEMKRYRNELKSDTGLSAVGFNYDAPVDQSDGWYPGYLIVMIKSHVIFVY